MEERYSGPDIGSPLIQAIMDGDEKRVRALLAESDIRLDGIRSDDGQRYSAVHTAAYKGKIAILEMVLNHPNTTVEHVNNNKYFYQNTPLHCAIEQGHPKAVKMLLSHEKTTPGGANSLDEVGNTPLHSAVPKGHDIVNLLLSNPKVDVNVRTGNNWGYTPLHLALFSGEVQVACLFLEHPAIDITATHSMQGNGSPESVDASPRTYKNIAETCMPKVVPMICEIERKKEEKQSTRCTANSTPPNLYSSDCFFFSPRSTVALRPITSDDFLCDASPTTSPR